MADRDEQGPQSELVDALTGLLFLHIKTQSDLRPFAWDVANGGIDLGGGRRIAIIEEVTLMEPMVANAGAKIVVIVTPDDPYEPTDEDELLENGFDIDAALGAVTPDPEEGPVLLDYGGEPCGDEEGQ